MNVIINEYGNITGRVNGLNEDGTPMGVPIPEGLEPSPWATYWNGANFVAYTEEQRAVKGVRIPLDQEWSNVSMSWVDLRSLEQAREDKWEEVKKWRALAIGAGLATPYGSVDSKESDRKNITDAVMLAQTLAAMSQPVAIEFTMADNSVVTMDASMMTNVGLLLGQKTQAAHARARELRAQIATATKEQLAALTWD